MVDWARNLSRNGQIVVAIGVVVLIIAGLALLFR
jgi:hypothetical protein